MTTSKAATREELEVLHRHVLLALLRYFESPPKGDIEAAWVKVAVAFLEMNDIAINTTEARDIRQALSELSGLSLPFPSTTTTTKGTTEADE